MNSTIQQFKQQQKKMIELLKQLIEVVELGEKAGMPADTKLNSKIKAALNSVSEDKLKVALVGGFSEGKTSIAAAWMERLDKSSMNISHQESSNAVKLYDVDEEFVLIDTPGLFGFKELTNEETHSIEKYKNITKKYISEAHLILYVMNSTNPIKESHREELNWLFRTLNLLPRTVFVLSRFDEVADVEDEDDYSFNFNIKKNNVKDRLRDLVGLSNEELEELVIVAVAANPFDLGFEYWLENFDKFRKISHIDKLQQATNDKIQHCGGYFGLIEDMQRSVISDILDKQIPEARSKFEQVSEESRRLKELNTESSNKLTRAFNDIEDARTSLRSFAASYFSDLIIQAKGCSLETFSEFYEREIGADGVLISTAIKKAFTQRTSTIMYDVQKMQIGFNDEVDHFNTTILALGKDGVSHMLKGNLISQSSVLGARDGLLSVGKTVGVDLGSYLKFKPWGAAKFAKGANGALAILGVALEVWDSWEDYKRKEEFEKMINSICKYFEEQRKEIIEIIDKETFCEDLFPGYVDLRNQVNELGVRLEVITEAKLNLEKWNESAEALNAKFRQQQAQ